jgi:hypothetical protein
VSAALIALMLAAAPDAWSQPVDGLRGRLALRQLPDQQLAIDVELENVSDRADPIAVAAGAPSQMVRLALETEDGKPVPNAGIGGNELTILPYALKLPVRSTLRMTIAPNAYEHVGARTLFRPYSLLAWEVGGKTRLFLRATLVTVDDKVAGPRAWKGPLELPRVALP